MTEREEFDKWCHESLIIPMGFDPVDMMWAAWQAARASRWRSMESAPSNTRVLLSKELDVSDIGQQREPGEWWDGYQELETPEAWHPLPDPPTKEELENLK